jgi:hypothetical protein
LHINRGRIIKIVFLVLFFIVFFFAFLHISLSIPYNSDSAVPILESYSILHGNVLLHSWYLSSDNFYTIDLLFYIIAQYFFGFIPQLMQYVQIVIYLLMAFVSLYVVNINNKKIQLLPFLIYVITILTPSYYFLSTSLMGPTHIGTVLFSLIGFLLIYKIQNKLKSKYLLSIILFIITTLIVFGDPFGIWIAILPIILSSLIYLFINKNSKKEDFLILGTTLLALIVGETLRSNITKFGGFRIVHLGMYFASLQNSILHLYYLIYSILKLNGSYFFSQNLLKLSTVEILLRLIITIALFIPFIYIFRSNIKKVNRINLILALGMLFNILAFIFGNVIINTGTTRYLIPFVIFGGILLARTAPSYIEKSKKIMVLTIIYSTILILFFVHYTIFAPTYMPHKQENLITFLNSHKLKDGYATYWNSSILTVETKGSVNIRSVVRNGTIYSPYLWLNSSNWYKQSGNFLIVSNGLNRKVNINAAVYTFGKYEYKYIIKGYTILVWKNNISNVLYLNMKYGINK